MSVWQFVHVPPLLQEPTFQVLASVVVTVNTKSSPTCWRVLTHGSPGQSEIGTLSRKTTSVFSSAPAGTREASKVKVSTSGIAVVPGGATMSNWRSSNRNPVGATSGVLTVID